MGKAGDGLRECNGSFRVDIYHPYVSGGELDGASGQEHYRATE